MKLILLLVIVFIGMGLLEHFRHRRSLRRIPIRIHVNGTRGKSSVTRLIFEGLRAGGIRSVAKTTGSAARYIHPDGSEEPLRRVGPPNIKEQIAIMRRAAAEEARALVIECMAVRPDLQIISEEKIVQSGIGVITNARPDHLEVMGPTLHDVARSLSGTIPRGGRVFTSDRAHAGLFRAVAERRGSAFHLSDPDRISARDLEGFRYVEHAENVSLALDVCESVGVPRDVALAGMRSATPDIGALTRVTLQGGGKTLEFINAFAANDPASTLMIWKGLGFSERDPESLILLVNLRGDRMKRSRDLAVLVHRDMKAGFYVLIGEQTHHFVKIAVRLGAPPEAIVDLGGAPERTVYEEIFRRAPDGACVVGVGNIGGAGRRFMEYLEAMRGAA
jgi:poly-gamma-glutamate synthase PgsB/CapB